jgi:site-specific recombinase XerD
LSYAPLAVEILSPAYVGYSADKPPRVVVSTKKWRMCEMDTTTKNQWSITKYEQDTHLLTWIEAFLIDRKAQGMAKGTLYFYQKKLKLFIDYCDAQVVSQITEITPTLLRGYMLHLEETGHNEGGRHACYRALKTFLYWWEEELEPEGWRNPIRRVKPPRLSISPLEPADLDEIKAMITTCDESFHGLRDKAILLVLLDTSARAKEFLDIELEDFNYKTGEILIREGKGGKFRSVFLGKKSRRAVRAYLRGCKDDNIPLWVVQSGQRLTYWGLRQILRRRAEKANVKPPGLHSFRRAFALNMLRAGVDIFSLQKLMGHSDLQVLRRYLAQTTEDIAQAHRRGSPVDNAGL